jgi:hypothetical protein
LIKNHVLLPYAHALQDVDGQMTARLTPDMLKNIVDLIPDAWLVEDPLFSDRAQHRTAYLEYLLRRLEQPHEFLEEAARARSVSV